MHGCCSSPRIQPCDIREVIEAYPEFTELYREVFDFRYHKRRRLVSMYSRH